MIDWSRVRELKKDIGIDGFDEVIELFLEEMDGRILDIQRNGFQDRKADLHFLKGCAANVGFAKLVEISIAGEEGLDVSEHQIAQCYAASKADFFDQIDTGTYQIKMPDNISSSVISR